MICVAFPAVAQEEPRAFTLTVEADLNRSGLMQYLLPRFALKTGRRGQITDAGGDALLEKGGQGRPALARAGDIWTLRLSGDNPAAARFSDWLLSDIGQNSLSGFTPADGIPFTEVKVNIAVQEVVFEGDTELGLRASLLHCGRCHRVTVDGNAIGIGSTPSFMALRALPDWADRFGAFFALNPHPSFMQIEGISPPFDPAFPPPIIPVKITFEEMEAIQAYASRLPPANLGAEVVAK